MRRVMVIVVAALVLVSAAALAVAATSRSPGHHRPLVFVARFLGPTNDVNNPPTSDHGVGPGDILTAHSVIYNAAFTRRLGTSSERCIGTLLHPFTMDCSFPLIFRGGDELLIEGHFNPTQHPWRAVVVGGTGRWNGARGEVTDVVGPKPHTEQLRLALR